MNAETSASLPSDIWLMHMWRLAAKMEEHLLQYDLVGGWATPLKNMKVNWDD